MLHGYCVRRAGDPGPIGEIEGVAGAAVRLLEQGGLGLWYSELDLRPGVAVEHLRQHDAVIRLALRSTTPLPLRYGASFASREHATNMLRDRQQEMLDSLDELANRLEMGIRISHAAGRPALAADSPGGVTAAAESPIRTGRDYLERRRKELAVAAANRAVAEAALDRIQELLADLELPTHREVMPQEEVLGLMAHLVHRREVAAYRERVLQLRDALPELNLVLSGPWAPYSFV